MKKGRVGGWMVKFPLFGFYFLTFLLGYFFFPSDLFSKTDSFVPGFGMTQPSLFSGIVPGREVGQVFLNPAAFSMASRDQVTLGTSQGFFDYQQWMVSSVFVLERFRVGAGYYGMGVHDIREVSRSGSGRPSIGSQFQHLNQTFVVAMSTSISEHFSAGIRSAVVSQELYTDHALAAMLDMGVLGRFRDFYAQFYTTGLYQTPYHWRDSGVNESLPRTGFMGGGWRSSFLRVEIGTDFSGYRLGGEVWLESPLSLFVELVLDQGLSQYHFGVILELEHVLFQFGQLSSYRDALQVDQTVFGLMVRF